MSLSSLFSSVFSVVHADAPEEKEAQEPQEESQEEEPQAEEEEEEEPEDVRFVARRRRRVLGTHALVARVAPARAAGGMRAERQVRAPHPALRALRGEGQCWPGLQGRGLR